MGWTKSWVVAGLWGALFAGGLCASAADAGETSGGPKIWTAEDLAPAIVQAAQTTSFGKLEAFGRQAAARTDRASLDRVSHVAWILLNQSEFKRFNEWNNLLLTRARAAGDERYVSMAQFNALRARFDQNDPRAQAEILSTAGQQHDWMARTHALTVAAYVLVRLNRVGEALRLLSDAAAAAPRNDPYRGVALARVWELESLALLALDDLDGGAMAAGRSQFEMNPGAYPRPDFDSL